jgi:hypothetical protein
MNAGFRIPPIKVAEVFVDGNCVGFLKDVKLSREEDGGFNLEGEWSGYADVLDQDALFTISIPRFECRFLAGSVDKGKARSTGRICFKSASFLPDSPHAWFEDFGEKET